jgi:biopolymer transport protein ExbD
MRMKRHRQPLEPMASLNITNLLDTAFILLITFMLVAPQLTHGIKLDLPEVAAPPMSKDPAKTVLIGIAKRREGEQREWIYLGGDRVTVEGLYEGLRAKRSENPDLAVVIEGDKAVAYGVFYEVIDAVKRAGVDNIGLSAEYDERARAIKRAP